MITFENGAVPEREIVRIQKGSTMDPKTKEIYIPEVKAKDVPVGEPAWQINQRGMPRGERFLGRRL
jgi:hypothetical protein